ncbi:MAG TPA: ribosome maturation factor RimP [Micromonosporaceae bacterium]|nr:ribosome maturation factor RimP [Micromonosporaceae bacterium]
MVQRNRAGHGQPTPTGESSRGGRPPVARSGGRRAAGAARQDSSPGAAVTGGTGRIRARLREVVEPVLTAAGCDLEELSVSRAGRRLVVRVVVDGDEMHSGVIGELSRGVSNAIDAAEAATGEIISGEYVLEVSSPGVDRPLTQPRHWRRNIGRLVAVRAGEQRLTGRVTAVDDDGVTMQVAGRPTTVRHAGLGPGRVQLELARAEEAGESELAELRDDPADPTGGDGAGTGRVGTDGAGIDEAGIDEELEDEA